MPFLAHSVVLKCQFSVTAWTVQSKRIGGSFEFSSFRALCTRLKLIFAVNSLMASYWTALGLCTRSSAAKCYLLDRRAVAMVGDDAMTRSKEAITIKSG